MRAMRERIPRRNRDENTQADGDNSRRRQALARRPVFLANIESSLRLRGLS